MTIERARILIRPKPWGASNLHPWSDAKLGGDLIGELSYERSDAASPPASLLLKLLFTSAPLSIQVHPDNAHAKSLGLPNGKSEAWYVLEADAGAKVALGLSRPLTRHELCQAIDDGSIEQLVSWQTARAHDTFNVPAGTIHAIGAGMVLAEIQQRSDATFRLFDHDRERTLHAAEGAAAAHITSAVPQALAKPLSPERLLLVSNAHFVFERIVLTPGTHWQLEAERETWLMIIDGAAAAGSLELTRGDAIFAQGQAVHLQVGASGATCLVAYTGIGGPIPELLEPIETRTEANPIFLSNALGAPGPIGQSR
jgi:mannose-6-phosphate isomerase